MFLDFSPLARQLAARGITDSSALCGTLLEETGVALLPGVAFERAPAELTARMAYVNFDGAKALSASETVPLDGELPGDFVHAWCANVVRATEKIVEWLAAV